MSSEIIYSLLGKISITFASLEYTLINLLEYLFTDGKNKLVRPYLLDNLSLARLVRQTCSIAEIRLWEHKPTFSKLKKILNDINELRGRRNLFIHGYWNIVKLPDNTDSITVLDFKATTDKKSGLRKYLKTEKVSSIILKGLLKKTTTTLENLKSIDADIHKLNLK